MYDVIVCGGGPAGMTAAIYAARSGAKVLIIEKLLFGGQMNNTSEVENYPGFSKVQGFEIGMAMEKQMKELGVESVNTNIVSLDCDKKAVKCTNASYEGKAIIIATGSVPRRSGAMGEEKFAGRGVSYCAVCDGGFYKDKTVCVIGGGNTALEDAEYLSNVASKVYLVHRRNEFRGQLILQNQVKSKANIEILTPYVPVEIKGENSVSSIILENKENGEHKEISVDGVFVCVGSQPISDFIMGNLEKENGYIVAGEDTKTNIEGIYAAGDIRTKALRQIATAVSDGAYAGTLASEFSAKCK